MQIFQGVQISRPVPFDRNGIVRAGNNTFVAGGPQSAVVLLTYTVPAGKRAFLEVMSVFVQRQASAGAVSLADMFWSFTKSGGSRVDLLFGAIFNNSVGAQDNENMSQFGFMGVGDKIELFTTDQGTGGSVFYDGAYKLMEFDP